jgi:hypothetical protein
VEPNKYQVIRSSLDMVLDMSSDQLVQRLALLDKLGEVSQNQQQ